MLTTPTILMSLGTQQVNISQVPSGHSDDANTSFADSFDEGFALIDERQTHLGDGNRPKDDVEGKDAVPDKNTTVMAVLAGTEAKADAKTRNIQNESGSASALSGGPASTKEASSSPGRGITIIEELRWHSGQVNRDIPTSGQVRLQDGQLPSESGNDIEQKLMPALEDEAKTAGTQDEVVVPQSSGESSAMPTIPDNDARQTPRKLSEILNLVKNQETAPAKTTIESNDKATKTEKTAKTEKKEEKPVGIVGNTVEAEAATIINAPLMLLPTGTKEDAQYAAIGGDALSSIASETSMQSVGTKSIADSKGDNKSAVAGRGDGESTKTADFPLAKDPAVGRPETDAEKLSASSVKAANRDNTDQKATPSMGAVAAEVTHAEPGSSAVAFGGISLSSAVHTLTVRTQTAEMSPHAASGQAGSGAIDPSGSIDAHKMLMVTPTTLEVGVANGTHGWLKIRAEMTGGAVNASLSTATSSGQEMLHRELPSLTAYLQSERVAVNAVVIQPAVVVGADARGLANGMNGSAGGQSQQGSNQGGENRQATADTLLSHMDKAVPFSGSNRAEGDELLPLARYAGGGSWLSVRA